MRDSHAERMARLARSVLEGAGALDPAVRQAAATGGEVPEALARYVEKVRRHAYRVRDDDVRALLAAGYSEDQVFELTVSTALGAALERLRVGLGTLDTPPGAEREGE
jgi:alkylhydroperoxidase family enzyme